MLTRSMFAGPRMRVHDLQVDPAAFARSAGELATDDLPMLIRRADIPGRLEDGIEAASDVIQGAIDQLPGRQRRNPLLSWLPGLAIVGVLVALLATSWWMVRGATLARARERELAFDQDALDRAADDGMPAAENTASGHMAADGPDVSLHA